MARKAACRASFAHEDAALSVYPVDREHLVRVDAKSIRGWAWNIQKHDERVDVNIHDDDASRTGTISSTSPGGERTEMRGLILYSGALAQVPRQGGLTWLHLQFLLGLRRLGWDVLFLDRLEPEMCTDRAGLSAPFNESENLRYFLQVMKCFDLQESFSLSYRDQTIGLARREVLQRATHAEMLLNTMGYCNDEAILSCARRRVFL